MTKASQHKDAAVSLIKHLTSPESLTIESETGLLVARQSVFDKVIEKAAGSGVPLDKKRLIQDVLRWYKDNHPIWFRWLNLD